MSDTDDAQILVTIRSLVKRHLRKRVEPTDDAPLVSGGLVDSMSLVDLILELEDAFGVRIPASEVQPDDFDSILTIGRTVARFR